MSEIEATPDTPSPIASGLVDLSDLKMMPAWISGMGSSTNLSKYEEREERAPRRDGDRRGGPPPRRDSGPPRRDGGGFGGGQNRDRSDSRPPRRDGPPGQGGGPRRDGPPGQGGPRQDRDQRGGPRRFGNRDDARPQRDWVEIPRDIQVVIEPEEKSAEALANHIRTSGHAFSMFDAARLVLAGGDRFHARFTCASERASGLFMSADGGLFLTRDEATQHLLRSGALETFYRSEEIELEEPKGDFKSVGICGFSGELIAPPNHHSFQSTIIRLHRERYSNMPLEDYKRRIRVESDPELVTKWKENQKKGMRWIWLKDQPAEGAEPTTLNSRAEMESHFRRMHGDDAVKEVREALVIGNIDKSKLSHVLHILLRNAVETARKHLFEMSQKLGGNFERRGLKLFKRRAGKLFVCRVKPKAVDSGLVFSARVTKILEVLKGKSGIMLHDLVEAICPSPPAEAPAEGETPVKTAPTDEQITVIKDIRWLANEGYVIEYSDGMVLLGVQGEPQTAKATAPAVPSDSAAPIAEEEANEAVEVAPAAETVVESAASENAPEQATTPAITVEEAPVTESESVSAESSPPVADEAPASISEEAAPESAAASSDGETASA